MIKNMVCFRCKLAVEEKLKKLGLTPVQTELGEVTIAEKELTATQEQQLREELTKIGFELLDDKRKQIIEQIKSVIINEVHYSEEPSREKFSSLISKALHYDYSYLSNLFSQVEGITIEQFILTQKIEKVKELLVYGDQSLSEIAFRLGYSSTAHLSSQFKKITGLTASEFKKFGVSHRKSLDGLN